MSISSRAEFEFLKKKKSECDYCYKNEKNYEFCGQTSSYYRNKVSGIYFYCSEDCKDAFYREKRLWLS